MKMGELDEPAINALRQKCARGCGGFLTKREDGFFYIRDTPPGESVRAKIAPSATLEAFDRLIGYLSKRYYFPHTLR